MKITILDFRSTATCDAENRLTSVADQGSTTLYTYTDDGTRAIQRGLQGEVSYANHYYTVQNNNFDWKEIIVGDQRIVTKNKCRMASSSRWNTSSTRICWAA